MTTRLSGRSAFLALLQDEGITHLFGNPGTTELPIMHALAEHPSLTYVMAMQESVVVSMADGFSRASGQLVAANVHVAPGLGNAMGALFGAKFTRTPMILTAGQQEQGHGLREPLLYDSLVRMAEPLVKWAIEVTRLEDLPRIVRRAAKIARTPPMGPVFISLPGDILNAEAELDLGARTDIDSAVRPNDNALMRLAQRILAAKRPVMIVGDELVSSNALAEAAEFAQTIGCPVLQQTIPFGAHFPSEHPCFIGALSRSQPKVRQVLSAYDLLIAFGTDPLRMSVDSPVDPLPDGMPIVQVGLIDWDIGKNYPVEIAIRADVRETFSALTSLLQEAGGATLAETAARRIEAIATDNWSARRRALVQTIETKSAQLPIDPDWLLLKTVEALPQNAIFVEEALTAAPLVPALLPYRDRFGFHGLASGGIGWGLPGAVGASLANPGRPVVCFTGDGSAMYTIQALWTAAHHRLPVNVVLINNGGYRIIKQRLLSFHGSREFVGMDFTDPSVDFAGLARSLGLEAIQVSDPATLAATLQSAFARPGTKLIEVMVEGSV
ncbi:MAG: thiamine pyrophosphate-binding protein [Betaproteobacteria bacterium]|nr:thiamine pyrophosphate-binding protein [Betaproteobacteria bacterium]